MLVHYDLKLPLKLICDGSQRGIGAAIVHTMTNGDEKPIAFASMKLTPAQSNYSALAYRDRHDAISILYYTASGNGYLLWCGQISTPVG